MRITITYMMKVLRQIRKVSHKRISCKKISNRINKRHRSTLKIMCLSKTRSFRMICRTWIKEKGAPLESIKDKCNRVRIPSLTITSFKIQARSQVMEEIIINLRNRIYIEPSQYKKLSTSKEIQTNTKRMHMINIIQTWVRWKTRLGLWNTKGHSVPKGDQQKHQRTFTSSRAI